MKCTISNIMQFLTYIIALGYEGLNFVYKASLTAYQSRRDRDANNMLNNNVSKNQLSPQLTDAQIPCDPAISICPPTERPVRPSRPIVKLRLGHVEEQTGVKASGSSGGQEMVPFIRPRPSAFYADTFSTAISEFIQRLKTCEEEICHGKYYDFIL